MLATHPALQATATPEAPEPSPSASPEPVPTPSPEPAPSVAPDPDFVQLVAFTDEQWTTVLVFMFLVVAALGFLSFRAL